MTFSSCRFSIFLSLRFASFGELGFCFVVPVHLSPIVYVPLTMI